MSFFTEYNFQNVNHKICLLIIMIASWSGLYAAIHYLWTPKAKVTQKIVLDTKNRIVSIIYGIFTFVVSTYIYLYNDFDQPNTEFQSFVMIFCVGYEIYDMVACAIFGLADFGLVIHHTLCLFGFGSAMFEGYGAMGAFGGLFVAEASSFPMHVRIILRNFGLRYTRAYEFTQNLYLAIYIVARGIVCPVFVVIPIWKSLKTPLLVQIASTSLNIQSYYYIIEMKKIIVKKISQYKEMKQKKIQYWWFQQNEEVKKLSFYRKVQKNKIF